MKIAPSYYYIHIYKFNFCYESMHGQNPYTLFSKDLRNSIFEARCFGNAYTRAANFNSQQGHIIR